MDVRKRSKGRSQVGAWTIYEAFGLARRGTKEKRQIMERGQDSEQKIAAVADALSRILPGHIPYEEDPEIPNGSVLVKYVTVVDWLTPDGERIIGRLGGNADGDAAPSWDLAGLLHEALNGDWP